MTRNAALLLVARIISAITTLAVLSIVARLRGPDALGLVALGFSAGLILNVFTELGLGTFLVREGARRPEETAQLLGNILMIRLLTLPLVLGTALVVLNGLFGEGGIVVWLAATGLVFQQWAELARTVSLSRRRFGLMAMHTIAENVAWLAVIWFALAAGAPLSSALSVGVAVCAASVAAGFVLIRLTLKITPARPSIRQTRVLIRDALPFTLFGFLGAANARLDTILVGLLAPGAAIVAAGAYFAASRLVAAFEYVPETLSRSLLPDLASGFVADPQSLRLQLQRPTRFLLFVGVPVPFAMVVFGPWLMQVLFGERIGEFGWILVALATLVPLRFILWLFGVTLTSADSQWRRVAAGATALGVAAALDVVLLPRIGLVAAVVGAIGATLVMLLIYAFGVARLVGSLAIISDAMRALVAAIAAVALALIVRPWVGDALAGVVFGSVYGLAVVAIAGRSFRSELPAT